MYLCQGRNVAFKNHFSRQKITYVPAFARKFWSKKILRSPFSCKIRGYQFICPVFTVAYSYSPRIYGSQGARSSWKNFENVPITPIRNEEHWCRGAIIWNSWKEKPSSRYSKSSFRNNFRNNSKNLQFFWSMFNEDPGIPNFPPLFPSNF